MQATRTRLAGARRDTAARLAKLGIRTWLMPRGGFYLWCSLPDDHDASTLARTALRDNVVLAPGNVFSVSQSMPNFARFNVSQMVDARILDVLARALSAPVTKR
jgi:DNA-binding transcriptional MocR family regulator